VHTSWRAPAWFPWLAPTSFDDADYEGLPSSYDFDNHCADTVSGNGIAAAIDDAIGHTRTPSALPDTPLDLDAAQAVWGDDVA